jgi:hypothetical protein
MRKEIQKWGVIKIKIKTKGYTYYINKLPSGKYFVLRSDAKRKIGKSFTTKKELYRHYPNLKGKI